MEKISSRTPSVFTSATATASPSSQTEAKFLSPIQQTAQSIQGIAQRLQNSAGPLKSQLAPFYFKPLQFFFEKLLAPSIDFSLAQFSMPIAPAISLEQHLRFSMFAYAARLSPDSCARMDSYFETLAFLPAFEQAKELLLIEGFSQNLNILCAQILQPLLYEKSRRWDAIAEGILNQLIAQLGELSRKARDPIARSRIQFFALYLHINFFPILKENFQKFINYNRLRYWLPTKQRLPRTLVEKLNQTSIRLGKELKNTLNAAALTYVAQPRQQIEKRHLALLLKITRQGTIQLMQSCLPNYPHLAKALVRNWRRLHAVPGFISPHFLPTISIRYNIQPHVEELSDGSLHLSSGSFTGGHMEKISSRTPSAFTSATATASPSSQTEIKVLSPIQQTAQSIQVLAQRLQNSAGALNPQIAPFYFKAFEALFTELSSPIDGSRAQLTASTAPQMRLEQHLRFLIFAHASGLSLDSCARIDSYFEALAFLPAFEQAKELLHIQNFFQSLATFNSKIVPPILAEGPNRFNTICTWIISQLIDQLGELAHSTTDPFARSRWQFLAVYLRMNFALSLQQIFPVYINSLLRLRGLPPQPSPLPQTLLEKLYQANARLGMELEQTLNANPSAPSDFKQLLQQTGETRWKNDPTSTAHRVATAAANIETVLAVTQERMHPAPLLLSDREIQWRLRRALQITRHGTIQLMQLSLPNYPHLAKALVRNWRRLHAVPGFISPHFLPTISIRYNIQPHVEELPDGTVHVDLTRRRVVVYGSVKPPKGTLHIKG